MSRKNKETQVVQVAKKVVEAQGEDFKAWSEEVIARRQFELIKGMDAKWKEEILEEECRKFVIEEFDKKLN